MELLLQTNLKMSNINILQFLVIKTVKHIRRMFNHTSDSKILNNISLRPVLSGTDVEIRPKY